MWPSSSTCTVEHALLPWPLRPWLKPTLFTSTKAAFLASPQLSLPQEWPKPSPSSNDYEGFSHSGSHSLWNATDAESDSSPPSCKLFLPLVIPFWVNGVHLITQSTELETYIVPPFLTSSFLICCQSHQFSLQHVLGICPQPSCTTTVLL